MSHNVGNGGTFGIDAYLKKSDGLRMQPGMVLSPEFGGAPEIPTDCSLKYYLTDYKGSVDLSPSDAALAAVLILKDVLDRNLLTHLKRPSSGELAELKGIVDKIHFWD